MRIDDKTYIIDENCRYKTQTTKTQIIIGFSLRKGNNNIIRLQHKDFGKTNIWNTYTINRNGEIFQHYDPKYYSNFLGIKKSDKQSISIVLENMGSLFEISKDIHVNWINEICDEEHVIKKKWGGYDFWENIYDSQIESIVELCKELCDKFNIEKNCIEFNNYHKDIDKFNGIVFKSNYIDNSNNINPLFDIEKFNNKLQTETTIS